MDSGPLGGAAPDLAVEIVISNYNYGRFLADAVDSALAQTHAAVRTIVVDDGSTDTSREVLGRYEGRVDAILKENGGQASAVNAGLERCSGDVVMMLDADDVLDPGAAARVAEAFAASPDLVRVQYRMKLIDGEGAPTGLTKPAPHLPMPEGDMRAAELSFPFDLTWMSMSGNAFRLAELRRVLPVPEPEYRICADWYLVHSTALLGPIASLDDAIASYRMHGDNSYEPQEARVDLDHVRENIRLARATTAQLERISGELEMQHPEPILSIADLANRMISLRLDPASHPLRQDTRRSLVRAALGATRRRFDSGPAMKAMYAGWFAAMAVAPRRGAGRLAELFLFPQRRPSLNWLLARTRTSPPESA
jgi:hypothetical protein